MKGRRQARTTAVPDRMRFHVLAEELEQCLRENPEANSVEMGRSMVAGIIEGLRMIRLSAAELQIKREARRTEVALSYLARRNELKAQGAYGAADRALRDTAAKFSLAPSTVRNHFEAYRKESKR